MKKIISLVIIVFLAKIAFGQTKPDSNSKPSASSSQTAFRVKFEDVFTNNSNGSITPKYRTQIGGVIMGPGGVSFGQGVSMGGVDIALYKGHDLLIDTLKGVVIIRNIFK
ncbi:MAG TPA: hypothetical protein VG367_09490 [Mucilaginibacter sp.]|nr:hypothetical protein [Mucilaginibacter sp.]